uniref:FBA_2 domain-containing protein n=1 Tax=Caenorhabditis tropicalis TaxID=1561998 RepID=A0A1I7TD53_9PELO
MTFPLLKLPSLAYENVILNLSIDDVKTPWQSSFLPAIQIKVAFDYVQHLLRVQSTEYNLEADDHQGLLPQLFGFQKCASMSLFTAIPAEELKYVLEKVEISEKLDMRFEAPPNFEIGFARFRMDELKIDRAFWITNETFLTMDCVKIELTGNRNLSIRDFVSQWLSSRNTRFEWISISAVDEYWYGFEGQPWNPKVRDRFYRAARENIDCARGIDIVREDGLLATVLRRFRKNYFLVWHERFQPDLF